MDFLGKHPAKPQLIHEDYSYKTYSPLSITRYSFIQLNELEQCGVNELVQLQGSPGFVTESPKLWPLSDAPLYVSMSLWVLFMNFLKEDILFESNLQMLKSFAF